MIAPKTNRLLSLVAAAAVLPLLGLYALLMYIATPSPTGGMEPTVTTICYIAFTFIFSALIIVALNFSKQLSREAKGVYLTP
jgi:O-antigen ligase